MARIEYPTQPDPYPAQGNGVAMPGPMTDGFEDGFNFGLDYSNLFPDDAAIANMPPQLHPDSQDMGAYSQDVGLDPGQFPSYVSGLDSDGSSYYVPEERSYDIEPDWDSMQGLVSGAQPGWLENENMWLAQPNPIDVSLELPESLSPAETSEEGY